MRARKAARVVSAAIALAASSPAQGQAPAPRHAATNCVACHDGLDGLLQAAVSDWRGSVHARAGIGCDGCHGGDLEDDRLAHSPSVGFVGRPRMGEVPYMCGKCHAELRNVHLGSVHGRNDLPHCASCHGSHAISAPNGDEIITEQACSKCHPYDVAKTAQDMLARSRALIGDLQSFAAEVEHLPTVIEPLREMQRDLHLDRMGVVTTFHSFRIGDIQQIGANADRVLKTIVRLREREEERERNYARERPIILALMGFFLLAAAFGYFVYHGGQHPVTPPEKPA